MMQTNWQKTVSGIITAIWIYTLAGIAGSIVSFVDGLMSPLDLMDLIESLSGGGDDFEPSGLDVLGWLFDAVVIGGYIYFYSSISKFVNIQENEVCRTGADEIKSSYLLMIIAVVLGELPVANIIGFILMIVAYVKQIKGYRVLGDSGMYNKDAVRGTVLLRKASGWILVSNFISWIPLVGGIVDAIIVFATFIVIIKGWQLVAKNEELVIIHKRNGDTLSIQLSTTKAEWYADMMALKSDDELREIVSDENRIDVILVAMAEHELTERSLNKKVRLTNDELELIKMKRISDRQREKDECERLKLTKRLHVEQKVYKILMGVAIIMLVVIMSILISHVIGIR